MTMTRASRRWSPSIRHATQCVTAIALTLTRVQPARVATQTSAPPAGYQTVQDERRRISTIDNRNLPCHIMDLRRQRRRISKQQRVHRRLECLSCNSAQLPH